MRLVKMPGMRRGGRASILILVIVVAMASAAAAASAGQPLPPGVVPGQLTMPSGHTSYCRTTGPGWIAYGIHTPNAPQRTGTHYDVSAWGVSCPTATQLLHTVQARTRDATIPRSPAGFTCKSRADGAAKNRLYSVTCRRTNPPAMFWWEAANN
jgi:hypothetical protein